MRIPEGAERIISRLEADGYEAFVVGGCVRDMLMGRVPEDWDITTSASPMQIKELFRRTIDTGLRHGTVTVMDGNVGYEVTTYRVDGVYEDYRHPQKVTFTKNLHEDLKRRDFTINAMAYNPRSGIVDLYGGQEDIASKIIRSVGNAKERFSEDALRMLRAVRFAGQLGFSIEEQTFRSICELAPLIRHISKERIRVELSKLLISDGSDCFRLIEELCLLTVFLPEWSGSGYSLSFVKEINILCKTNRVSVKQQVALLFAALLHENTDSKEAGAVCRRLTFDNDTIKLVERLIACQDKELPGNEVQMRFFIHEIGKDIIPILFLFLKAKLFARKNDMANAKPSYAKLDTAYQLFDRICQRNDPVTIGDLKISGKQLLKAGIPAGPEMGRLLHFLLEQVLIDPGKNQYDILQNLAVNHYRE